MYVIKTDRICNRIEFRIINNTIFRRNFLFSKYSLPRTTIDQLRRSLRSVLLAYIRVVSAGKYSPRASITDQSLTSENNNLKHCSPDTLAVSSAVIPEGVLISRIVFNISFVLWKRKNIPSMSMKIAFALEALRNSRIFQSCIQSHNKSIRALVLG